MLFLLVVNYHCSDLICKNLIKYKTNIQKYRLLIIDNSSDFVLPDDIKNNKSIQVIQMEENFGFGKGCNEGLLWIYNQNPQALVWLLNPDILLSDETFDKILSVFKKYPELSILGSLVYSKDQKIWFGGGRFNRNTGEIFSQKLFTSSSPKPYYVCDWVSGCSMIINLKQFQECPQFDPNYFLYYEDFDFCQRYQRQGHLIAVTNQISIVHEVSTITNRNLQKKFYHSTYSYLFTLERYTHKTIFYIRLTRLLIYALLLLPVKPSVALGKITGAWHYLQKRLSGVTPFID